MKINRSRTYVNIQLVIAGLATLFFALSYETTGVLERGLMVSLIFVTLLNCWALYEGREWTYFTELIRLFLVGTYISYLQGSEALLIISTTAILLVTALDTTEKWYYRQMFGSKNESSDKN
jgi:alkylglycerol monooxygenase